MRKTIFEINFLRNFLESTDCIRLGNRCHIIIRKKNKISNNIFKQTSLNTRFNLSRRR